LWGSAADLHRLLQAESLLLDMSYICLDCALGCKVTLPPERRNMLEYEDRGKGNFSQQVREIPNSSVIAPMSNKRH